MTKMTLSQKFFSRTTSGFLGRGLGFLVGGLALGATLLGCGQGMEPTDKMAQAITTAQPAAAPSAGTKLTNVYITWYGFNDNSCQVESEHDCNTIAFPKSDGWPVPHNIATEGSGTYADPITFATAAKDSGSPAEFAPGTIIYVPLVHKYFVMEDQCAECGTQWFGSKHSYHVDLWMGPSYGSADQPLNDCEDSLTLGSANKGTGVIIVNPPSNLAVDTNPLFENNTCTANTYPNQ